VISCDIYACVQKWWGRACGKSRSLPWCEIEESNQIEIGMSM